MTERTTLRIENAAPAKDSAAAVARKPALDPGPRVGTDHVLFLQRTIGNQAVGRLFLSGAAQPKLSISRPDDRYEQEADRVADQIMRAPDQAHGST